MGKRQNKRTCGSTNTKDGKPCQNGHGCIVKHQRTTAAFPNADTQDLISNVQGVVFSSDNEFMTIPGSDLEEGHMIREDDTLWEVMWTTGEPDDGSIVLHELDPGKLDSEGYPLEKDDGRHVSRDWRSDVMVEVGGGHPGSVTMSPDRTVFGGGLNTDFRNRLLTTIDAERVDASDVWVPEPKPPITPSFGTNA